MDAAELPPPANVVVSKVLVSDTDPSRSPSCSTFGSDTKTPHTVSGYGSDLRNPKIDEEHEHTTFRCEENDRSIHVGEADKLILPLRKHDVKPASKKSLRRLSSYPCSKGPRDQQNDFICTAGADDPGKKITYDPERCPSDEKSRIIKLKRGQDSKRSDKKIMRAGLKTKYDPLTSKTGFTTSDPISGGNNILGKYGPNADLHEATKHVEELSLNELLDGSYKYSNLFPDKGKRASNANDNILLSVEKACSILLLNGATESSSNRKASTSPMNPPVSLETMSDCDEKDKCTMDVFSKVHDPVQANSSNTSLYQPGAILERLALPPSQDLEALISSSSINSVPSQWTMCMKTIQSASLPPFPWSFTHSGPCKPGLDSGRLASNRNTCHNKWFRIGSYSTSNIDDQNCFPDLETKKLEHSEDSINKQKVDDLVQYVKKLAESVKPQLGGAHIMQECPVLDNSNMIAGSGASGFICSKLQLVDGHADSSDNHVEHDFKEHVIMATPEPEVALRCQGSDIKLADPCGKKEHSTRNTDASYYNYLYKCSAGGSGPSSLHSCLPGTSSPGHSPRLLAAAAILCEMKTCFNDIRKQNDTCSAIESQKAPLPNTAKALEKTDSLVLTSKHHDTIRRTDLSMKQKLMIEKKTDSTHLNNSGREPVRWPIPAEGSAARRKLEKVHLNQRLSPGNSIRPSGSMPSPSPSPTRVEKVYDDQQKLRKAALKASSTTLGRTYIKDWSRGRSKRL